MFYHNNVDVLLDLENMLHNRLTLGRCFVIQVLVLQSSKTFLDVNEYVLYFNRFDCTNMGNRNSKGNILVLSHK